MTLNHNFQTLNGFFSVKSQDESGDLVNFSELIFSIKNKDIVVPEFQREYVWPYSNAKELLKSLINGFPVGGILIWRTASPPALKGMSDDEINAVQKVYQVLLDGQQRMTTMYLLATGEIPPYYKEDELSADPRTLCFNLQTRDFQFLSRGMQEDPSWQLVADLLQNTVSWPEITEIASQRSTTFKSLKELENFEFDYDVVDRSRAFGEIRTLIESTGLKMKFASQQIWNIILPTKIIKVTIPELYDLHEGAVKDIKEEDWGSDEYKVSPDKFQKFWQEKIKTALDEIPDELTDVSKLIGIFSHNYNDLLNILKAQIPVQEIPTTASFSDAIDIFDKINSRGVHLSKGELALTHVTSKWPEARRVMKEFQASCANRSFHFNLNFLTRLLVVSANGRALFETIRDVEKDALETAWKNVEEVVSYLIDILKGEKVDSSELLNGNNVLIPPLYFLCLNGKSLRSDLIRRKCIYWIMMASMWSRYSGSAESALEEDLNIIRNSKSDIWDNLVKRILDQRGRLSVEATDLQGAGINSRFYRTFYIYLKNSGARDWFNGLKIDEGTSSNLATHRHHIFPKAYLEKHGLNEKNEFHSASINEIANSALITGTTNIQISAQAPEEYFGPILENYPNALESQLIPDNPELWKIEHFDEFLSIRRKRIAEGINKFLDGYKTELSESDDDVSVYLPESETQEYKETWQFDIHQSNNEGKSIKNQKLQLASIKTVAAFLNTNGGNLFIGVSDDNSIEGLDRDLEFFGGSLDKLHLSVSEIILNSLGADKKPYYTVKISEVDGKHICHIKASPCHSSKTWVNFGGTQYFFIRDGNGTKSLSGEDADSYWTERAVV